MKKVMLTLAVVAFVASLASCTKTCSCDMGDGTTQEVELPSNFPSCADMTTGTCVDA